MRKVLCLVIGLVLSLCTVTMAADVSIKDAAKDVVTITGNMNTDGIVSVMILNPGYEASDVLTQGSKAVQLYTTTAATGGEFVVDVRMVNSDDGDGGDYTLIYSDGTETKTETFNFFFYNKKLEIIDTINEQGASGSVESAYRIYSLTDNELYKAVKPSSIASVLSENVPFAKDVNIMYDKLVNAMCIAAYCEGSEILLKDGKLSYVDVVDIDDEPQYEDYLSSLSDTGVKAVNDYVLGGDYKNNEAIANAFSETVVLNCITNAKNMGFGHVEDVFSKYEELLDECGIDTDMIDGVKNKNSIYKALASSGAKDFSSLQKTYDKAIDKAKDSSSGGSSSGGSSSGSGGGGGFVPSSSAPPVVSGHGSGAYIENTSVPFADMDAYEWARESVAALYRRNIISGRSSIAFDPSGLVTREEFAKMSVLAFIGETNGENNPFADVNGWSAPYVATAFSKGIIQGVSETQFNPGGNITREQAATIIERAMKECGFVFENEPARFKDDQLISPWAKESVGALAGEEIILGRGGDLFCPHENMTRAEAAKLIYTAMVMIGGIN